MNTTTPNTHDHYYVYVYFYQVPYRSYKQAQRVCWVDSVGVETQKKTLTKNQKVK